MIKYSIMINKFEVSVNFSSDNLFKLWFICFRNRTVFVMITEYFNTLNFIAVTKYWIIIWIIPNYYKYQFNSTVITPFFSNTFFLGPIGLVSLSVSMQLLSLNLACSNISIFPQLLDKENYTPSKMV